jgi:hypothetical protein
LGSWPQVGVSSIFRYLFDEVNNSEERSKIAVAELTSKRVERFAFVDDVIREIVGVLLNSTSTSEVVRAFYHNISSTVYEQAQCDVLDYFQTHHEAKHRPNIDPVDPFYTKLDTVLKWFVVNSTAMMPLPCASECSSVYDCFRSGFDKAALTSRALTDGCDVVYYTIGIHREQTGLTDVENKMSSHCYVAFVKENSPLGRRNPGKLHGWNIVLINDLNLHLFGVGRRASRIPKISPAHFFARSAKFAVYFDTGSYPKIVPNEVSSYMVDGEKRVAIAMLFHRMQMAGWDRVRSPMKEIDHILRANNTAQRTELAKQRDTYQAVVDAKGIEFSVMPVGSFIIHDIKSQHGHKFRCEWLNEYLHWGDRDQPPLYYVLAKLFVDRSWKNRPPYSAFIPIGGRGDSIEFMRLFNHSGGKSSRYLPYFREGGTRGYNVVSSKNSG